MQSESPPTLPNLSTPLYIPSTFQSYALCTIYIRSPVLQDRSGMKWSGEVRRFQFASRKNASNNTRIKSDKIALRRLHCTKSAAVLLANSFHRSTLRHVSLSRAYVRDTTLVLSARSAGFRFQYALSAHAHGISAPRRAQASAFRLLFW